jgi:hypothetical protein
MSEPLANRPNSATDSWDRRAFLHKAARSVTEIQSNVNNLADVLVFLEVLGYNSKTAVENGFRDLNEMARRVYAYIDFFENAPSEEGEGPMNSFIAPISSAKRRLFESLGFALPWLAILAILYTFGFSLWLTWILPLQVVTALAVGVFFGTVLTEGQIQTFSRLLMFCHGQGNESEARRIMRRVYRTLGWTLGAALILLYAVSRAGGIPPQLFVVTTFSTVTIAVHRITFLVLYTLRKMKEVLLSYGAGLASMLIIYFGTSSLLLDMTTRYLVSLGATFVLLSGASAYYSNRALALHAQETTDEAPHFYHPPFVNRNTIRPRFRVQLWETLPYFLFGTSFITMLFADRVLSWFYNPARVMTNLPLLFNATYHSGADPAMFVFFPVGLLQYMILTPIYERLANLSLELKVTETRAVARAIRRRYMFLQIASLGVAGSAAISLILLTPTLTAALGAPSVAGGIMSVAAVSNVLISLYLANSQFMIVFNRPKWLPITALAGALIVGGGGAFLGQFGFEKIVYAYFVASAAVAGLSFVAVKDFLRRPADLFFARFV